MCDATVCPMQNNFGRREKSYHIKKAQLEEGRGSLSLQKSTCSVIPLLKIYFTVLGASGHLCCPVLAMAML